MHLILIAALPPLIWALVNHIDKYAVEKYMHGRDPGALILFTGLAAYVMALGVYLIGRVHVLPLRESILMIGAGAMLIFSYIPYLYAIAKDEASNVAPLFQMITPLSYVLALIFLRERIGGLALVSGALIFLGALILSFDFKRFRMKRRSFLLMLLSSVMIAGNVVIFKAFALHTSFSTTAFYDLVGAAAGGTLLFAFVGNYRRTFIQVVREHRHNVVGVNLLAETLSILSRLINGFVSLALPVAIVQFVNGLQPLFIVAIGTVSTLLAPGFATEAIGRKDLVRKGLACLLMLSGFALLSFLVY